MATLIEALAALCIVFGALLVLAGSLGIARLPDFLSRVHAPTKASSLGLASLLAGSMLAAWLRGDGSLHEALVAAFILVTSPVAAYLYARVGMARRDGGGARE